MFKYDIANATEFIKCMNNSIPVYIERRIKNYPIPQLYGLFLPFTNDEGLKIALCAKNENTHLTNDIFEKMIINLNLDPSAMVKIYELKQAIYLYEDFDDKSNYNLFVLDDVIERNIENK